MKRHTIFIMMAVAQAFMSATYLMAKVALGAFSPMALGFLRFFIAAAMLMAIARVIAPQVRIAKTDRKYFFFMALLAVPLNQGVFLYAMQYASAAHGALLYATTPVMVLALSALFLRERLSWLKLIGVLLGFMGVAVIILERGITFSAQMVRGDALLLVAVLTWAIYTILNKKMVKTYAPIFVTARSLFWGFLMFIPVGLPAVLVQPYGVISWRSLAALGYLAIITSVCGYWVWSWGLSKLEASRVSVFSNLQPILAALQGWFFLREAITLHLVIGIMIVISGVIMTEWG